jgi:hypothetical protein
MIQSGTVTLAKGALRLSLQWLTCSALLFVLQVLYPALRAQIEHNIWMSSLSQRPDGRVSALILDGGLSWFGLSLGFLVSSAMYVLALAHWRQREVSWRDLTVGMNHLQSFLTLSFSAVVAQQVAWSIIGWRQSPVIAVGIQLLLTWIAITPFLFVVPLILERNLGPVEAAKESLNTVARQPVSAFLLVLSAGFWSLIGLVACGFGLIWTQPIYQLAIARAYLDCFSDPVVQPDEPQDEPAPPTIPDCP